MNELIKKSLSIYIKNYLRIESTVILKFTISNDIKGT